jgi:hypothetical protein
LDVVFGEFPVASRTMEGRRILGIVMSGRAPADQGLFFGVALVAGAVMSSAFFCGE